jgi:hypothetical protein
MIRLAGLPLVLGLFFPSGARAEVRFAQVFGDHQVLQREMPVPIWGTAKPGEAVAVTFAAQTKRTVADCDGRWTVRLDPMPASAEPRELKVQGFINVATTTLADGTSVYPKPDRWRDTVSINIGTGATNENRKNLFSRSYEYLRMYWPDATATDEPIYYADYNSTHWLIAPTPDEAYPVEVVYYQLPELLDDTVQTNWVTEQAPQLLLYAALLEAAPFLGNDERIAVWQSMYDRAAATLQGEDLAKILDRAAVRKEA